MDATAGPGMRLRWRPDTEDRAGDRVALARLAGAARLRHRCPECGADDHGVPEAVGQDGRAAGVRVSLARAGGWVLLAASASGTAGEAGTAAEAGEIGVDVEEVAAVAASGFDDVAFDDRERERLAREDDPDRMRARLWSAKEAILKAAGTGLRTDPRRLGLEPDADGRLVLARSAVPGIRLDTTSLYEIEAPPGLVATVCILHR